MNADRAPQLKAIVGRLVTVNYCKELEFETEIMVLFALVYFALLIGIPLGILGVVLHRVRILKHDWKPVLAKAIGAIAVWLLLSFVMMYVNFIFVYAGAHTSPEVPAPVIPMLIFLAATMGYGLAGWGLCYWVNGRATNSEEPSWSSRVV